LRVATNGDCLATGVAVKTDFENVKPWIAPEYWDEVRTTPRPDGGFDAELIWDVKHCPYETLYTDNGPVSQANVVEVEVVVSSTYTDESVTSAVNGYLIAAFTNFFELHREWKDTFGIPSKFLPELQATFTTTGPLSGHLSASAPGHFTIVADYPSQTVACDILLSGTLRHATPGGLARDKHSVDPALGQSDCLNAPTLGGTVSIASTEEDLIQAQGGPVKMNALGGGFHLHEINGFTGLNTLSSY
jgi:hypothetical protein